MDCPTCGWGVILIKEFEEGDLVVGHYKCRDCPIHIEIKSPTKWMIETGRWE
jgi:hypothetical protein|tara:strand:- start:1108 stop:1263 length:156 start_codon:yes stop_codon:yes gene_type:complete